MITLYHGSDFLFTKFQFINVGKKGGTSGAGFGIYLTDNCFDATTYGKYLYTVEAQLKQEINNVKLNFTRERLRTILRYFENISSNSYIENYDYDEDYAIKQLIEYCESDVDVINDIINATGCPIEMMDTLAHFGYTHTTDKVTPNKITREGTPTVNYCIFDLRAIKIVKREESKLVKLCEEYEEQYDLDKMYESWMDNEFFNGLTNLANDSLIRESTLTRTKTLEQAQGRAKSKSQRRLMAMALAYKRGKLDSKYASDTIKKLSKSISEETLHDFAKTNQKKRRKDGSVGKRNNIPQYVKGSKYKNKK